MPLITPEAIYRQIWVKFQRAGIHRYPAAATDPKLADVAFLAHPHRHLFHFNVAIQVVHNDRDIEFLQFSKWLNSLYEGTLELDYKSCEMLSEELINTISERYPGRNVTVTVSEDDENGATLIYQA
ncbi:hypothetical protein EVB91_069 [Rhizobium phage RHph_I1_18]|nr:hypothetical protein EVB91_069 [Rhizobium phage RHph_I1_18]